MEASLPSCQPPVPPFIASRMRRAAPLPPAAPPLIHPSFPPQHFGTPDGRYNKKLLKGPKKVGRRTLPQRHRAGSTAVQQHMGTAACDVRRASSQDPCLLRLPCLPSHALCPPFPPSGPPAEHEVPEPDRVVRRRARYRAGRHQEHARPPARAQDGQCAPAHLERLCAALGHAHARSAQGWVRLRHLSKQRLSGFCSLQPWRPLQPSMCAMSLHRDSPQTEAASSRALAQESAPTTARPPPTTSGSTC